MRSKGKSVARKAELAGLRTSNSIHCAISFAWWVPPSSRRADDQVRLEHNGFGLGPEFGAERCERNTGSFLANALTVLVDAGKRNAQRVVVVKVPATDERNVLRDPQALIQREIHCTHRERMINHRQMTPNLS
jgi:hypothetical protein